MAKFANVRYEQTEDAIVAFATQADYNAGRLDMFLINKSYENFHLYHAKSDIETKQIYMVLTKRTYEKTN